MAFGGAPPIISARAMPGIGPNAKRKRGKPPQEVVKSKTASARRGISTAAWAESLMATSHAKIARPL